MFVAVNGVKLFVEVMGTKYVATGPRMQERPTVVALHGGPSDQAHMREMAGPISEYAQVVLYDHRGCGRSEHGDPALWRMEQWGDDVRGLSDALGIEKPIVIGASFGGFVAQSYATRHPEHAAKLGFLVTGARMSHAMSAEGFRKQGGDTAAAAYLAMARDPTPKSFAEFMKLCRHLYTTIRTVDADLAQRTIVNLDLLSGFFKRYSDGAFDFREGLQAVRQPVLVLGGAEDPVTPPPYQDELAACLTHAKVTRVNLPNAGHFVHTDAKDAYFRALKDFILG